NPETPAAGQVLGSSTEPRVFDGADWVRPLVDGCLAAFRVGIEFVQELRNRSAELGAIIATQPSDLGERAWPQHAARHDASSRRRFSMISSTPNWVFGGIWRFG